MTQILRTQALVFTLGLYFLPTGSATAGQYGKIVAFGDSLSDIGNHLQLSLDAGFELEDPPATRYFDGRYSNGEIWLDTLARLIGIEEKKFIASTDKNGKIGQSFSVSYAYGSAGTGYSTTTSGSSLFDPLVIPGLLRQVEMFEEDFRGNPSQISDSLFTIFAGANDYLLGAIPGSTGYTPNPDVVVSNIDEAVRALYHAGARHFLVPNLPDLGATPGGFILAPEELSIATSFHNWLLANMVTTLRNDPELDGATFLYLDLYTLFEAIEQLPQAFGLRGDRDFSNLGPASNCLVEWQLFGVPLGPQNCDALETGLDGLGSVFWDEVHPTETVHRFIGIRASVCLMIPGSCAPTVPGLQ